MLTLGYMILGAIIGGAYYGDVLPYFFGFIGLLVGFARTRQIKNADKKLQDKLSLFESIILRLEKNVDELQKRGRGEVASEKSAKPEPISYTAPAKKSDERVWYPTDDKVETVVPVGEVSQSATQLPQNDLVTTNIERELAAKDFLARKSAKANFVPPNDTNPDSGPGVIERAVRDFFTGGNLFVRLGIVILFFSVAFLLKLAADNGLFPIEMRLCAVASGAIVLIGLGWRLRIKRPGYALSLQGGGIGIFYLTIYGAFGLFHLIPPSAAFALLVLSVIFAGILAVGQDSRALAVMGVLGGFLAPILASSGSNNYIGLFSYYALLDAGIFGIAWFKSWRPLNVLGFIFTFGIGSVWGFSSYVPENLATVEPFLVVFFICYALIPVLYALRQSAERKGFVDGTLVFGTPIVVLSLQSALVWNREYALAWSTLVLGAYYLALTFFILRKADDRLRFLSECFLSIGVVFATLTVPLAFSGSVTGAVWAVEGAGLVWVGSRQKRLLARFFGCALILMSGFGSRDWVDLEFRQSLGLTPILNAVYLTALLKTIAALFAARVYSTSRGAACCAPTSWERGLVIILEFFGVLWWFYAGTCEILLFAPEQFEMYGVLAFVSVSCTVFAAIDAFWDWDDLKVPAAFGLPFAFIFLASVLWNSKHPLQDGGQVAWPLTLVLHIVLLKLRERHQPLVFFWKLYHAAGLWLFTILLTWETAWRTYRFVDESIIWARVTWFLVPTFVLIALITLYRKISWPVMRYRKWYLVAGAIPIATTLLAKVFLIQFQTDGNPAPLMYFPLLNPMDLSVAVTFVTVLALTVVLKTEAPDVMTDVARIFTYRAVSAILFVWLTAVLMRTLHFWTGVPYRFDDLYASMTVQTALSIFWCLYALALMVFSNRKKQRGTWAVAAALLGVVVLKLFTVDLSNRGTVFRVISFTVVGVLLLLIGYVSPLPPKKES